MSPTNALLLFSVTAENVNECKVDDPGDDNHGQDCIFPFVWDGKKYDECTNKDTDEDWPCRVWCATNELVTDDSGWGYCSKDCPLKCKCILCNRL